MSKEKRGIFRQVPSFNTFTSNTDKGYNTKDKENYKTEERKEEGQDPWHPK